MVRLLRLQIKKAIILRILKYPNGFYLLRIGRKAIIPQRCRTLDAVCSGGVYINALDPISYLECVYRIQLLLYKRNKAP